MLCASNSFHSVLSTILETNSHKSTARTLGRPASTSLLTASRRARDGEFVLSTPRHTWTMHTGRPIFPPLVGRSIDSSSTP
jgi:hypothetical protein